MKKLIFIVMHLVIISAELSAMYTENNQKDAKNLYPMYDITNLQTSSMPNVIDPAVLQVHDTNLLDDNLIQDPSACVVNSDQNLPDYSGHTTQNTNSDIFTSTLLSQSAYTNPVNLQQEWPSHLYHHILMNGNNKSKIILKDYLIKMKDLEKKKKEIEIQMIEEQKNFIKDVFEEIFQNDASTTSENNLSSKSDNNENAKKRKCSFSENDDSVYKISNVVENPIKKRSTRSNKQVFLLPIDEIVYSRNKVTSHWIRFFNDSNNSELSKSEIDKINEKSEYKTKEVHGIKSLVSNWNTLSEKKKTAFNKALKKRREEIEQKNKDGQIVNILENEDVRRDFFAAQEIKNLITSGDTKEKHSSMTNVRFRMIMRMVLGQKPKDIWDAEYKGYPDEVLRKYMLVGVVLSDISTEYKSDIE